MDLFYDDEDYLFFLETLKKYKDDTLTQIFAYCLMNNHVHIILKTDEKNLPLLAKKIGVRYSYYFNGKFEHVGHVFQNRYKSECIDDENYLASALRYVIRNPENAGICKWQEYKWSSAADYLGTNGFGITDTVAAQEILSRKNNIISIIEAPINRSLAEPVQRHKMMTDNEATEAIAAAAEYCKYNLKENINSEEQKEFIKCAIDLGVSCRQLERITGINRRKIKRICRIS